MAEYPRLSRPERSEAPEHLEEYHTTRPLAPPYSLHTALLKVESYNDKPCGEDGRAQISRLSPEQAAHLIGRPLYIRRRALLLRV